MGRRPRCDHELPGEGERTPTASEIGDAQLVRFLCRVGTYSPALFAKGAGSEIPANSGANVPGLRGFGHHVPSLVAVFRQRLTETFPNIDAPDDLCRRLPQEGRSNPATNDRAERNVYILSAGTSAAAAHVSGDRNALPNPSITTTRSLTSTRPTCRIPPSCRRARWPYQGNGDKAKAAETSKRAANMNILPALNYAFVRSKAKKMAGAA